MPKYTGELRAPRKYRVSGVHSERDPSDVVAGVLAVSKPVEYRESKSQSAKKYIYKTRDFACVREVKKEATSPRFNYEEREGSLDTEGKWAGGGFRE